MASTLARRVREGSISETFRARRWAQFRLDWRHQYEVVELSDSVYAWAEQFAARYPLRTLDALQVASALAFRARAPRVRLEFWTADRQQAAAADAEGLDVELLG